VRADGHERRQITVPPEEDAQIVIDGEGPIPGEVPPELVGSKKRVSRVDRKPTERGPEQCLL